MPNCNGRDVMVSGVSDDSIRESIVAGREILKSIFEEKTFQVPKSAAMTIKY